MSGIDTGSAGKHGCEAGRGRGFVCDRGPGRHRRGPGLCLCAGHAAQARRGTDLRPLRGYTRAASGTACTRCDRTGVRNHPRTGERLCSGCYQRLYRRGWPTEQDSA